MNARTDAARASWTLRRRRSSIALRHGHGTLALGRLHPLLHARQVGRDPLGHDAGVARPVLGLDRQAVLGQGDQLGLGPAAVQPRQGVGHVAIGRLAEDLGRSRAP